MWLGVTTFWVGVGRCDIFLVGCGWVSHFSGGMGWCDIFLCLCG